LNMALVRSLCALVGRGCRQGIVSSDLLSVEASAARSCGSVKGLRLQKLLPTLGMRRYSEGGQTKGFIEVGSMQDFQSLAEASKVSPIILDFYADWCGPCKQLSPKLEKAAKLSGGGFQVAKIDVEAQELAPLVSHLKISSLPTMMALYDGQIIANSVIIGLPDDDKFGAYVKMIEGLKSSAKPQEDEGTEDDDAPSSAEDTKDLITKYLEKLKEEGFPAVAEAAQFFSGVLSSEGATQQDTIRSKVGLALCALKEKNIEIAKELVKSAEEDCDDNQKFGELEALKARLELYGEQWKESLEELEVLVQSEPGNLEHLHRYASALFVEGHAREAMEAALLIVKKDKAWNDEAGRVTLVKFFDLLGSDNDLVKEFRKKLSNAWYV